LSTKALNRPKSCSFERKKKKKKGENKAIEGDETLTNSIKQSTQQRGKKKEQRKREREREDPSPSQNEQNPERESSMLKSEVHCTR
jgi:hypothetical protein